MTKFILGIILFSTYLICMYLCAALGGLVDFIKIHGIPEEGFSGLYVELVTHPHMIWEYRSILTVFLVFLGTIFFFSCWMINVSNRKKFMLGKEHGTSEWGTWKEVNKKFEDKNPKMNRILSKHIRVSINDRKTKLNNNLVGLGGSGTGKTKFIIVPNILQHNSSCFFTDPSGEILRDYGNELASENYEIRVLNTVNLKESMCFNPFVYIHDVTDIDKLITMIIMNTTPKGEHSSDPFWEKAERMLLKAIMIYVYMEEPYSRRNLVTVIEHLADIQIEPKKPYYAKGFGVKIHNLPKRHPARRLYERVWKGADDTSSSIHITALSRFSMFDNNPELERILSSDEMDLDYFGTGYNGNPDRKMALFAIIPDNGESTYNFLIGMLYSLFFQRQYYVGDRYFKNRLKVPVICWLDELANIVMPEGFTQQLATVRKRNIGLSMIFQDISQIKKAFKDEWETLVANSDTFIYLGSNDPATQEYISKRFGNMTGYTRSEGHSFGTHPSSSNNESSIGRPLIFASELDSMDPDKCVVKIKGQKPVMDDKYDTFSDLAHKNALSKGEYVNRIRSATNKSMMITLLSEKSVDLFREMGMVSKEYEPVVVYPEMLFEMESDQDEEKFDFDEIRAASKEYQEMLAAEAAMAEAERLKEEREDDELLQIVSQLSPEQAREIHLAVERGIKKEIIEKMIHSNLAAEQLHLIRVVAEKKATSRNGGEQN